MLTVWSAPIFTMTRFGTVWAAWELSPSIAVLRRARKQRGETLDLDALEEMRRHLARLPETHHPLGLTTPRAALGHLAYFEHSEALDA